MMALTRNGPLHYIHSFKPSVGKCRWLYRLKLHWHNLLHDLSYSLLYNKSNQWSLSHTIRAMHVCCRPVPTRGAINTSLPAVAFVYAVSVQWQNFQSRQSSRGKYTYFWRYPNFAKTHHSIRRAKHVSKKSAWSVQPFQYNTSMWQTNRQMDTWWWLIPVLA